LGSKDSIPSIDFESPALFGNDSNLPVDLSIAETICGQDFSVLVQQVGLLCRDVGPGQGDRLLRDPCSIPFVNPGTGVLLFVLRQSRPQARRPASEAESRCEGETQTSLHDLNTLLLSTTETTAAQP